MAKSKPVAPRKIPIDKSLLSADDRKAIDKEVEASVAAEMEQDARDAYFAEQLEKIRRRQIPAARYVSVVMDMAPFLPHILIDGEQYFHGYRYEVESTRAMVLYEQMQRSWLHQDEIDGRSRIEAYRRPQNRVLGPQHINQPTRGANGIITLET